MEHRTSSPGGTRRRSAANVKARYIKPVSRKRYPYLASNARPTVVFPEAAGPSTAIGEGRGCRFTAGDGTTRTRLALASPLAPGSAKAGDRRSFSDRDRVQRLHLFVRDFPKGAGTERAEVQARHTDAPERKHVRADRGHHPPNLAILPLLKGNDNPF